MPRATQLAVTAIVALAGFPALADTTPEQAQALQQQVRSWIETSFGLTAAFLNALALRVVPERDHYRISARLGVMPLFPDTQNDEVSVAAQALAGGKWLIFDGRLPTPMRMRAYVPNTGGAAGGGLAGPLEMLLRFGRMRWDAIVDPSFATPSVVSTATSGYELEATAGELRENAEVANLAGHASLLPVGGGRIDIRDDAWAEDFSITARGQEPQQSVAAFLGRVEVSGKVTGLLPDRVAALVQSFTEPPANGGLTAPDRSDPSAVLRLLYSKLRGIATGGEFRETLEDVRGAMAGHTVGVGRLMLGWGIDASGNVLTAHWDFGVNGIAAPDIPPEVQPYVPRHVLVRQSVSGIDLGDLDALILAAIARGPEAKLDQPEIAERVQALFAHGGITSGLDALEVDVGGTHFEATGQMTALAPDHVRGQGRVSATGFDALIAQVRRSPEWGKVAPFLQLLGMLGKHEGDRIVWTVASDNADLSVNGLDIPALIAAGKQLEKH
ncbi:MAG: hypothetical protein JO047_04950 [Alphaproteobacteria bacterium]|nr:hypothetical protein [Alphaproteobacteria bacterium]